MLCFYDPSSENIKLIMKINGIEECGSTCPRDDPKHIFVEGIFYAAPRFLRSHHGVGHQGVLPGILEQKATN